MDEITIIESTEADRADVLRVEAEAFGYDKEAHLVAELLADESARPVLSLLALAEGRAVGHILFTAVRIDNGSEGPKAHILAPLAVVPSHQDRGVGGRLIRDGLARLASRGCELVFVLGHPGYYPRHGFVPDAGGMGFAAPYPIPDEHKNAWMVQALTPDALKGPAGRVQCAVALDRPEHWRE